MLRAALEVPADASLVLDVTHAFRAQPLFAAAALDFARAVGGRDLDCRVVYGAFEARTGDGSPIWDLTPVVDLMDWTSGLGLFLETGAVGAAARAAKATGRQLQRRWFEGGRRGERPNITPLANALQAFGDDLATVRTRDLLTGGESGGSAARLLAAIDACRGDVEAAIPPLGAVLDRIAAMAAPLPAAALEPEGRDALVALARLYLGLGRTLEAATTVREAHVNRRCATPTACAPGLGFDHGARRDAEVRWWREDPEGLGRVAAARNDLNHGGYNASPIPARKLVGLVEALVDELAAAGDAPAASSAGPGCFVNLSNHPSDAWGDAQREAALAMAPRLVDLPFPAVPPEAEAIDDLATATLARVPPEATAAMVMGEQTLCHALIAGLRARGVRCVAATTRREVSAGPDGVKRSRFRFVRFRDYPVG